MNVDICSVRQCLLNNINFLNYSWSPNLTLLINNIVSIIVRLLPSRYTHYIITNLWQEHILLEKYNVLFISKPMLVAYLTSTICLDSVINTEKVTHIQSLLDIIDQDDDEDEENVRTFNVDTILDPQNSLLCIKCYTLIKNYKLRILSKNNNKRKHQ